MRTARAGLVVACAALVLAGPAAAQTVKLATLIPEGSFWDRALRDMGAGWERLTGGGVELRIYPGGVAGDDPDMIRKLRIGQLQAATVTVTGLTEIDPAFALFEIPGFFDSYEELFHVLDALEPELERRLLERGFRLLHWGHGGWIYFFSTRRAATLAELQDLRVFAWAGNDRMTTLWREQGFRPVALAATDILPGLETGLFETLPTTPIAALSLQWFRSAPYMTDLPLAPLLGATIIDERAWQRLPADHHPALLAAAADTGTLFAREIPDEERKALTEMQRRGLEVVPLIGTPQEPRWREAMESFAAAMRDTFVPEEIYAAALAARTAFRDNRSIRSVDFANLSFPLWKCEPGESCAMVELVDGEGSFDELDGEVSYDVYLGFVRYGDVTGDGREEALVRLGSSAGGTGQFSELLVYAGSASEVSLVHRFPTGDRAHGSYLDACVLDRRLAVVREYSESCMACIEAIETTEYSWKEHSPKLESRSLEPHPDPDQGQCGLFDFVTVCGNRPFDFLHCENRGAARGD